MSEHIGYFYDQPIPSESLPLGGMLQAVPTQRDLASVAQSNVQGSERVVGAYEAMAMQLAAVTAERDRYKAARDKLLQLM